VKLFRAFAVASALVAFVIAVLGSWVRINDAGLTCPDWPLCHGALVPALRGGVVLEWSHRLAAFLEGFLVLGAIVTGVRVRAAIAGVTPALIALGVLFAVQVTLGGMTVFLSNNPPSVVMHWAMGMALLADLTVLAVLAWIAPPRAVAERRAFARNSATALGVAAAFAFVTMCAGAYVSSSHAGLACTTVPACDGSVLGNGATQHIVMLHRVLAAIFAIVAFGATFVVKDAPATVRAFAATGCALVLAQIALGIGTVVWQLPIALREAHAANAGATFLATVLAALEPYRAAARRPSLVDSNPRATGRPIASTS
jgi:heme A synthase